MRKQLIITTLLLFLTACANKPVKTESASEDDYTQTLAAVLGEGKEADLIEMEKHPLGSLENPVRVGGPLAERDYASRLICENNEPVSAYARIGSSDDSPFGNITDIYHVICDTNKGAITHVIYMDMYHHDYIETRPAKGFIGLKPSTQNNN